MPCLLLRKGKVCVPGPSGPVVAKQPSGIVYDVFETVDWLGERFPRLLVADLDGIERGDPQLDYLQEIARDADIWVDVGVNKADQLIDALVTGARRVVVSTGRLVDSRELGRCWKLSPQLAFEIDIEAGKLNAWDPAWKVESIVSLAREVHEIGLNEIILSPRVDDIDWRLVREVSREFPVWVDGSFLPSELPDLVSAGGRGGIFHIEQELQAWSAEAK